MWSARGADTPVADLTRMAVQLRPDLIVLTATTPHRFDGLTEDLARLAHLAALALAGAGATQTTAAAVGARLLTSDPVTAAEQLPPPRGLGHSTRAHPDRDPSGPGSPADAAS